MTVGGDFGASHRSQMASAVGQKRLRAQLMMELRVLKLPLIGLVLFERVGQVLQSTCLLGLTKPTEKTNLLDSSNLD